MDIISNGYKFRRGTGSPFDAQPNTSFDFGSTDKKPIHWCTFCLMDVNVGVESYNQNQVWGKKYWCKRCGGITSGAVYFHVGKLNEQSTPLLERAMQWANERKELIK